MAKKMTKRQVSDEIDALNKKIEKQGTLEAFLTGMYQKREGLLRLLIEAHEKQ